MVKYKKGAIMKKLILSILVFTALFAVLICGCNDGTEALKQRIDELEERVDELEKENDRLNDILYQMSIKDGEFYTLQQAYNNHWLTQEDLKSIAYYHNGGIVFNEEVMGEDYQPQPKTPEVLDKITEHSIKQTYIDSILTDKNAIISGVNIDNYYGSYNGCFPLMMSDSYSGTTGEESWQTVGDVKFYFNSGNKIIIWRADNSDIDGSCIDGALAAQIKNDFVKNNDDGVHDIGSKDLRLTVYGKYIGTSVMFIDGPWYYQDVITTETVGGVEFVYGSSRTLTAYNGGRFYSLEQAYENQLLTYDDLLDIKSKYEGKQYTVY